jgi:hypothetical protein
MLPSKTYCQNNQDAVISLPLMLLLMVMQHGYPIVAHFEGDGFRNHNTEEANSILEHLVYGGETRGCTLKKFMEKNIFCYLELA